ncbi:MAG: hypothetical protein AABZ55_15970 [Bdellovibrionota bacterium]
MSDSKQILKFIEELTEFAQIAEETLQTIEKNPEENKGLFSIFSERMFAIRGTAQQLQLPHIAHIAGLGEEISIKGAVATRRPQIRKCVGALWDALTTVKYLLIHHSEETNAEQQILINRLDSTLAALGGARPTFSNSEIQNLIEKRQGS